MVPEEAVCCPKKPCVAREAVKDFCKAFEDSCGLVGEGEEEM